MLKNISILYLSLLLFAVSPVLSGCSTDDQNSPEGQTKQPGPVATGCAACHTITIDIAHNFSCPECHNGDIRAATKDAAHTSLNPHPAHPEQMMMGCGKCHKSLVDNAPATLHFSAANEVNKVRRAFGATEDISSLSDIPEQDLPATPLSLADDLLRRRCLRCHLYYQGDSYPATRHGTGCAACHLHYRNGSLVSHEFIRQPTDEQCLSCHYGNFVGADYYGRFEHDYNWEYRTPFQVPEEPPPYGVEFHQLSPDIHQQAGMACIDCHSGSRLMGKGGPQISCRTCHLPSPDLLLPNNIRVEADKLILTTRLSGRQLVIPAARNSIHQQYQQTTACAVCHAQWSFADIATHLLRQDEPDFEPWLALTRQGSSEVGNQLETALFTEDGESSAIMTDKISGKIKLGLWLKSYERRRWVPITTCLDEHEILQVCRALMDLHLSYTDMDENVVFDAIQPEQGTALSPYTPHTIGPAGTFFKQRLKKISE